MRITRISTRHNAYLQQDTAHEPVPFEASVMIPENANPSKFQEIDQDTCMNCKGVKLIKKYDDKNHQDIYVCPKCNSRSSQKAFNGRSVSRYSMDPGTLNYDSGASTNNEAGGVKYHNEPTQHDSFSSNLGK